MLAVLLLGSTVILAVRLVVDERNGPLSSYKQPNDEDNYEEISVSVRLIMQLN